MDLWELKDAIFRSLLEVQGLRPPATPHTLGPTEEAEVPEAITRTHELVERLIRDAFENGFMEPPGFHFETTKLFGGAVAQSVGRASSNTEFAYKADTSPDLLKQAQTLRLLRDGDILPSECRDLYPRVYSLLPDGPPFTYLMEFFGSGYTRLSDYLFRGANTAPVEDVIRPLLDTVFHLFETRHDVLLPHPRAIYLDRVTERLKKAVRLNLKFRTIATSPRIVINSTDYFSYESYLDAIIPRVSSFQPTFSSIVHGDLHPGNIFFKGEGGALELKLIDPKSWIWGDYMFDVGKLLHYTMVTGPHEDARSVDIRVLENETPPKIEYEIHLSERARTAVQMTMSRVQEFATTQGDANFQGRLNLSLASNLLGLTENRLKREQPLEDHAILYYCEGLRYLKQVAEGL